MSAGAIELVDLVARWIHVIAAIMWIGNSLLFNWLDRNLRPASPETWGSPASTGTLGNIWLLHSGAFYFVEKTLLGGQPLPRPLHWFFVQAYTTWWSGVTLLIVVYYFGGRATLADAAVSARAKRVSIHNNYFTFPVIVLMLISHFPGVYGSRLNWLLLLVLIAAGAAVRHVLNIRFSFPAWRPALAATMVGSVLALIAILRFGSAANPAAVSDSSTPVTFTEARHVIDRRCAVCHSAAPSDVSFGVAPGGVMFDTPEQILARVARIQERAVLTRTMPPGNKKNITDVEREMLGRWIAQGATTH